MSCLNPVVIRSKAIGAPSKAQMLVPCGKCIECLKAKQRQWIYRLQREEAVNKTSLFCTLTYDEKNVPLLLLDYHGQVYLHKSNDKPQHVRYQDYIKSKLFSDCIMDLWPEDLQKFIKRLRKCYPHSLKYFACGEYGDQFDRPHYHIALFTNGSANLLKHCVEGSWQLGMTDVEYLVDARVTYITKYMLKGSLENRTDERQTPCFNRASHGLGSRGFYNDYLIESSRLSEDEYLRCVQLNNGSKIPVPRYFRKTMVADEWPLFDFEQQMLQEEERFKSQQKKFDTYVQDYKIKTGKSDFEKTLRNYCEDTSSERCARASDIERRRRKGI